jgi:hypothetical protein
MESKIVLVSISAVILAIAKGLFPMVMQEMNAVSMSILVRIKCDFNIQ